MKFTFSNARELFTAVLDLETEAKREALLEAVAQDAPELAAQGRELLRAHEAAEGGAFFSVNPRRHIQVEAEAASKEREDMTGTRIGPYTVLEKIGEGGMGVVYMAEQETPVRRKVALKVIKLGMDTKQVVARFEAERQALAMMDNPNIATLLDAGITENGRPYFVMELVRGVPITQFCNDNRLSIRDRLQLFLPVCQAIQHAHQKGVIHRDIKPTNILVSQSGGRPHPMVIDFGVAKAIHERLTEKTLFTHFAQMVGTPSYMSPEQAEMSMHDVDTRSDVYSLGVLLYELLTGTPPFPQERFKSLGYSEIQRILKEEEPPKPSLYLSQLAGKQQGVLAGHGEEPGALAHYFRGDLDWIVLKAIDKDRERRYETPRALAEDVIRHLNDEPVEARPPTLLYQLQKGWRRHRALYNAAAMVAVSLLVGIGVSLWMAWVATAAKREAENARARETALRKQSEEDARQQRLISYGNDMRTVASLLKENKIAEAKSLLDRYVNDEGIRGYYWNYLNSIVQGAEAATLDHGAAVRTVSLSRDGRRLASQTVSGRVRLFEIDEETHQGRLLHEFGGGWMSYGAQDGSVAVSPDGRLLASDQQGTLTVWNADSGELLLEEPEVVAPLLFTPDSASLLANTEHGLRVWDTAHWSSNSLTEDALATETSPFCSLRFTPDGRFLILCPSRFAKALTVFDMERRTVAGRLTGLDRPSVMTTDGQRVAAGGAGGVVGVWDLASGALLHTFKAHDNVVMGIAFSPDGRHLATGGSERAVFLWDTETYSRAHLFRGHHGQVWNLKASDSPLFASASMDHSVKFWRWEWQTETEEGAKESAVITQSSRPAKPEPAADPSRTPQTHSIAPGAALHTVLDAAAPGDIVELAPGTYEITETIFIGKPVTIRGIGSEPAILRGSGVPLLMRINTASGSPTLIEGLDMEARAKGLLHQSGSLTLSRCRVTLRTVEEFQWAISLVSPTGSDVVSITDCRLAVESVGDTTDGTPPDLDVILVQGGKYQTIEIADSEILNDVPNRIANGLETRGATAHIVLRNNNIHCQGLGIVVPNHTGKVEIVGNTIWSTQLCISLVIDSPGRNVIKGNTLTIEADDLKNYPLVVQDFIARRPPSCIGLGSSSAGVTVGFFYQTYLDTTSNTLVSNNTFKGNPDAGIYLGDAPEPENFGPFTSNRSHDNTIMGNDFSELYARHDIALGKSTYDNLIYRNIGLDTVFLEAGTNDRNRVVLGQESTWRYVLDEITSPALEGNLLGDPATRPMWVWLPPGYDRSPTKRYPVVYVLHGFTGDHTTFKSAKALGLSIGEQAAELLGKGEIDEMILVLADATSGFGGSMFASNAVAGDYLAYVGRDLVRHVDSNYRTLAAREHRGILGHSMGARGAFALAMTYPDVFGALAALSPSADFAVPPTFLDTFFQKNPEKLDLPTIVRSAAERRALLPPISKGNVDVNLLYAYAAALSPNPDNPPYYVDLPLHYPGKVIVPEIWNRWLDQDLVSTLERDGEKLKQTRIFFDIGVGPTTFMKEGHDIAHLQAALDAAGLAYTFVESPGDHLSHLGERTFEALEFMSASLQKAQ